MGRLELHSKLVSLCPNVYFQPPSTVTLKYPCIIYNKAPKNTFYGNDGLYISKQGYSIIVIDKNPDSVIADNIENSFLYCTVSQYYVVDNLNHTTLTLYY